VRRAIGIGQIELRGREAEKPASARLPKSVPERVDIALTFYQKIKSLHGELKAHALEGLDAGVEGIFMKEESTLMKGKMRGSFLLAQNEETPTTEDCFGAEYHRTESM